MKQTKFQFYSNRVNASSAVGWVSLERMLEALKAPKPELVELIDNIAKASKSGNIKLKDELKTHLYSFTPCVNVKQFRRYSDITAFTGLAVLDFDKIDNAKDFKEFIFEEYKQIIAAWLSPSKKGVKAFVRIPIVETIEQYKQYYAGITDEFEIYNGFDSTPKNAVLPLFISYDLDLLRRDDAETWTKVGQPIEPHVQLPPSPIQRDDDKSKIIIKMIDTGIDKITDNGHPQLRALSFAIGGYVANNYIGQFDALGYLNYKIANNGYLRKGIAGYCKTAKEMLISGMSYPLHLEDYHG